MGRTPGRWGPGGGRRAVEGLGNALQHLDPGSGATSKGQNECLMEQKLE